jgi:hypothetical protein
MSKLVQEYRILKDHSALGLATEVEQFLKQGWELVGGVGVCNSPSTTFNKELYVQAITRTT